MATNDSTCIDCGEPDELAPCAGCRGLLCECCDGQVTTNDWRTVNNVCRSCRERLDVLHHEISAVVQRNGEDQIVLLYTIGERWIVGYHVGGGGHESLTWEESATIRQRIAERAAEDAADDRAFARGWR